ncbi:hypothetical protein HanIR_Chr16g0824351 [Helianthus annuus]|nr:hypothetical protein HanIR_Chr16g0824351 [Helianthus annuus]
MILDCALLVVEQFDPSTLLHVELLLIQDMLETPMTGINGAFGTVQAMSPYLECKHYCS